MYVTFLEHPEFSENYNRYDGYKNPVILHKNWEWHLGRFPNMEKLNDFLTFAGLKLGNLVKEENKGECGMFRMWEIDSKIDDCGFTNLADLPKESKPFIGLSNGRLVTCYLWNDGNTLHIYRPNPNIKDIYNPLSIEEHIAYCRENGYV